MNRTNERQPSPCIVIYMISQAKSTPYEIIKGLAYSANPFILLAGATGLEPATSGVTGRRSNQLNYAPYFLNPKFEYRNTKQI